ncbi:MAG: hypothetical protein AABX28_03170 [Nanoarchaeota archaeon]
MDRKFLILNQKKAWIRIVEAFSMILLITGVLLIILSRGNVAESNSFQSIYDAERGILTDIQLNYSLRASLIALNLPTGWEDMPDEITGRITSKTPEGLECKAKVCAIGSECFLSSGEVPIGKDVYSQSTIIMTDLNNYNPRQLKLFCWVK